jgi:mitotic spindle assembly checkpoint protein MAD1
VVDDLTITQTTSSNSQQDQQTKIRLEMLEKTVIGLKDLNGRLEQELKEAKESRGDADPSDEGIVSYNSDQLDNLRKELFALRAENEKLNKRRNELEIENENLRLRSNNMNGIGGFEDNRPIKILHFANNPADLAYANHTNDIDKLKAEIERLKIRNKKLEEGHDELTKETMNMTMGVKENAQLKTQVQSLEAKIQQIKDVYKQANHDFREVCLFLFGYRIDRVGNRNYR